MNTLTDGSILRSLGVALQRDEQGVASPAVTVCAWCDFDQVQTRALAAQGKRVSHTICAVHRDQQLARARELNRQKEAA